MVLVKTPVWINYLNRKDVNHSKLIEDGEVAIHPFIIGELFCGKIKNRSEIFNFHNSLVI